MSFTLRSLATINGVDAGQSGAAGGNGPGRYSSPLVIDTPGTYTVTLPESVTEALFEVYGGGDGGQTKSGSLGAGGKGGGGAGYGAAQIGAGLLVAGGEMVIVVADKQNSGGGPNPGKTSSVTIDGFKVIECKGVAGGVGGSAVVNAHAGVTVVAATAGSPGVAAVGTAGGAGGKAAGPAGGLGGAGGAAGKNGGSGVQPGGGAGGDGANGDANTSGWGAPGRVVITWPVPE